MNFLKIQVLIFFSVKMNNTRFIFYKKTIFLPEPQFSKHNAKQTTYVTQRFHLLIFPCVLESTIPTFIMKTEKN